MENLGIKISDFCIIFATIIGPIAAVQVQKFIERATERKSRKLKIFYSLMATRATRLSIEHVSALNAIELEFGPSNSVFYRQTSADKKVIDAYRIYLDKLCEQIENNEQALRSWNERCLDLFIDLLYEMSKSTGYNFDKVTLKRGAYYPKGHAETENAQGFLREFLISVAAGKSAIPMRITEFPFNKSE